MAGSGKGGYEVMVTGLYIVPGPVPVPLSVLAMTRPCHHSQSSRQKSACNATKVLLKINCADLVDKRALLLSSWDMPPPYYPPEAQNPLLKCRAEILGSLKGAAPTCLDGLPPCSQQHQGARLWSDWRRGITSVYRCREIAEKHTLEDLRARARQVRQVRRVIR